MQIGFHTSTGQPVRIFQRDRRQHVYAIGATGSGKTNWLLGLMQQDLRARRGFCLSTSTGTPRAS